MTARAASPLVVRALGAGKLLAASSVNLLHFNSTLTATWTTARIIPGKYENGFSRTVENPLSR